MACLIETGTERRRMAVQGIRKALRFTTFSLWAAAPPGSACFCPQRQCGHDNPGGGCAPSAGGLSEHAERRSNSVGTV